MLIYYLYNSPGHVGQIYNPAMLTYMAAKGSLRELILILFFHEILKFQYFTCIHT